MNDPDHSQLIIPDERPEEERRLSNRYGQLIMGNGQRSELSQETVRQR